MYHETATVIETCDVTHDSAIIHELWYIEVPHDSAIIFCETPMCQIFNEKAKQWIFSRFPWNHLISTDLVLSRTQRRLLLEPAAKFCQQNCIHFLANLAGGKPLTKRQKEDNVGIFCGPTWFRRTSSWVAPSAGSSRRVVAEAGDPLPSSPRFVPSASLSCWATQTHVDEPQSHTVGPVGHIEAMITAQDEWQTRLRFEDAVKTNTQWRPTGIN